MSEHDEQAALFEWATWHTSQCPELGLLFAIPNGGHRHPVVAARLKAEGVRAGVPDICLPVARKGYHGLFVELKFGRNKPTPAQVVPPATQGPPGVTPTIVCKTRCDTPEPPALMTVTPTAGYRVLLVEVRK